MDTKIKKGEHKSVRTEFKKGDLVGEKSPNWIGDLVGYHGLHYWVVKNLGKPNKCEHCGTITAKKFEWANKSGEYKRDLNAWVRLCTVCHRIYDKIIKLNK